MEAILHNTRKASQQEAQPPSFVQLRLFGEDSEGRKDVEQHIHQRFKAVHEANLQTFLPYLITTEKAGEHTAVVGCRPATDKALFLEQYLPNPIEQALAQVFSQTVLRKDVVEIGNLVAGQLGASRLLSVLMALTLHRAGYRWLVFTATEQVRQLVKKWPMPLKYICEAEVTQLDDQGEAWGRYYVSHPSVMAGDLDAEMAGFIQQPMVRKILARYEAEINAYADRLRQA